MGHLFSPHDYHLALAREIVPRGAFRPGEDPLRWQRRVRAGLKKLLGDFPDRRVPLRVRVLEKADGPGYTLQKLVFRSEEHAEVPAWLLIPPGPAAPRPAVVCLQGHTPGMHISIGAPKNEAERERIAGGRDFALQAVRNGHVALALEQRCFGERDFPLPGNPGDGPARCTAAAAHALSLGKTLLGERVWDVMRGVDFLFTRPEVDRKRIACLGNSAGGTAAFYAACLERRIRVAVPSCCFNSYAEARLKINHCACSYIPGIVKLATMGDLAGLIAPRPLVIVSGRRDHLAPLEGVKKEFRRTRAVYRAFGAGDNLCHLVGAEGHRFYPELAWPVVNRFLDLPGKENAGGKLPAARPRRMSRAMKGGGK